MATENAQKRGGQKPGFASENTTALPRRRRGRALLDLPDPFAAVLDDYTEALRSGRSR